MFDRSRPPEELADFARAVEELGADDLWVVEDLRWAGSIASAATALAATRSLRVGIGIAPAPLRNPALLAMEVGTLARLYPGRVVSGLGHGVIDWMREAGALVPNRLDLLAETAAALRALLHGEEVTVQGKAIRLDGVRLVHPPEQPPPVVLGVIGPRSLEISGRIADGTLVVEGRGPRELPGIRALIDKGRGARKDDAGPDPSPPSAPAHEVIVLTHLILEADPAAARAAQAPIRAEFSGFLNVPEHEVFLASGDAATVASQVGALWEAGADTVVLRPVGETPLDHFARAVAALRG
jgi:alkanesulfonate monooxygenase SsuD/methylene tetrahydromethanopterin reductase-like flavin-dependent oxidoreductase (luciferase family)